MFIGLAAGCVLVLRFCWPLVKVAHAEPFPSSPSNTEGATMPKQPTEMTTRKGLSETTAVNPEPKQIEALAYELWLQRGCPIGDDQRDWFRAEEQLRKAVQRAA